MYIYKYIYIYICTYIYIYIYIFIFFFEGEFSAPVDLVKTEISVEGKKIGAIIGPKGVTLHGIQGKLNFFLSLYLGIYIYVYICIGIYR
jgi:predicted RNA-binding protein Jag